MQTVLVVCVALSLYAAWKYGLRLLTLWELTVLLTVEDRLFRWDVEDNLQTESYEPKIRQRVREILKQTQE